MDKWMEISLIIMLVLAIAGVVMLSGCTASNGDYGAAPDSGGSGQQYAAGNGSAGFGSGNGMMQDGSRQWNGTRAGTRSGMMGRGNITEAQRQQMMQAWTAACEGKAAGDACTVQGTFGSSGAQELNGTCSSRNGNLTCMPANFGGRPRAGAAP